MPLDTLHAAELNSTLNTVYDEDTHSSGGGEMVNISPTAFARKIYTKALDRGFEKEDSRDIIYRFIEEKFGKKSLKVVRSSLEENKS